jgi:hypothetical protein
VEETNVDRAARIARENSEREQQLQRIPIQKTDKSKWPQNVRPIAMSEADGLGIDVDGRLYWNGKPVDIIGRRLDLTTKQSFLAIAVAVFTVFAGAGTIVQAAVASHDWACKTGRPSIISCRPLSLTRP